MFLNTNTILPHFNDMLSEREIIQKQQQQQ